MKKITTLLIFLYFLAINTKAQKPAIKLRQSFESAEAKPEPAAITYTHPKDKEESFLIDAALGISFPADSRQTISAIVEYHRNTLVDEESHTIQAGLSYELFTNRQYLNGMSRATNGSTSVITGNGKYSNNRLKKIESIQITAEFTRLYAKGIIPGFLPNAWNQVGNQLAIEYFPSLGVEFEGRFKTEDNAQKGNIFRGMFKLNLSIYPFAGLLKNYLEVFANFNYKHDIVNTTEGNDNTHPSIETGVSLVLYRNGGKKISIGCSYNNLDDPALGKEKQNFWLVALKAKI